MPRSRTMASQARCENMNRSPLAAEPFPATIIIPSAMTRRGGNFAAEANSILAAGFPLGAAAAILCYC
jgi:hypothetical protein